MARSPAKDFVLTALMEQLGSKCLHVAGLPFEEGFEQRTAAVVEQYLPFVEALLRAGAERVLTEGTLEGVLDGA